MCVRSSASKAPCQNRNACEDEAHIRINRYTLSQDSKKHRCPCMCAHLVRPNHSEQDVEGLNHVHESTYCTSCT